MMKIALISFFILFSLPCSGATEKANSVDNWLDFFLQGSTKGAFRLRNEDVNDNGNEDSDALTLKSTLDYQSLSYKNRVSFFLQAEAVSPLNTPDYTTGSKNRGTTVIPDPSGEEFNQAYLDVTPFNDLLLRYGRQRILLDNQRFVGGVGFRQNEQTYDGFSLRYQGLRDTQVFYSYLYNVNRIFGEDVQSARPNQFEGDHDHKSHLLNVRYSGFDNNALTFYVYLLDVDNFERFSTNTAGVRLSGQYPFTEDLSASYSLEGAIQTDASQNPLDYRAPYYALELALNYKGFSGKLGYEVLESDDNVSFITPLATLHAFNGYTDNFLMTPPQGLRDSYLQFNGMLSGVQFRATYHLFEPDNGSGNFGSEWDITLTKKVNDQLSLQLEYAEFNADDFSSDMRKLWVTALYSY